MFVFTYFCKPLGELLPNMFAIKETRLGSVFTYGYFYMFGDRAWTCERTPFLCFEKTGHLVQCVLWVRA